MLATKLHIEELSIPTTLDDPAAADFIEMVGVRNAIETALLGSDALAYTPAELLPVYQAQEFEPGRIFVARVDGRQVGRAVLQWSIADGTTSSWVIAEVLEEFRHQGIGTALFDRVEGLAIGIGSARAAGGGDAPAGGRRRSCAVPDGIRRPTGAGPRRAVPDPPRLSAGADRADQLPRPAGAHVGAEPRITINCSRQFVGSTPW